MTFIANAELADGELLSTVDKLLRGNHENLYREALNLLLRETEIHPLVPEYWDWLSRCHLCIGERESAKEAFKKFIVISLGKISFAPSNNLLMLEYPRMIDELGGVKEAESIYLETLSQQPANLQVIKALSEFYAHHKSFDKSLEVLENGLSTTHDVSLQIGIVQMLCLLDKRKEALEYAERAVKKEEGNALLHEVIGRIHLSKEDHKKAESRFRKAIDLSPLNPHHWYNYGLSLLGQKKLNDAKEALLKSVGIDESLYEGWNTLGAVYTKLEDFKEAERTFKFIIEKWPDDALAYSNLGKLYIASGMSHKSKECFLKAEAAALRDCDELLENRKFSECMNSCARAVQYNPKSALACAFLSYALINLESFEEALKYIEKAIDLDQECSEAWTSKAYFELANRRLERAERFALKAVDLKPDSGRAREILAVIQNEVGKYPEAEDNIRLYLRQRPTSSSGAVHLCHSLLGQGRPAESINVLAEALFKDPWSAVLWYSVSTLLSKLGLEHGAAVALQRARELHPGIDEQVTAFRCRQVK